MLLFHPQTTITKDFVFFQCLNAPRFYFSSKFSNTNEDPFYTRMWRVGLESRSNRLVDNLSAAEKAVLSVYHIFGIGGRLKDWQTSSVPMMAIFVCVSVT